MSFDHRHFFQLDIFAMGSGVNAVKARCVVSKRGTSADCRVGIYTSGIISCFAVLYVMLAKKEGKSRCMYSFIFE
jgi:hypothetical protein